MLEIGFGSGLNIPYYPAGLKRVRAVDPAAAGRQLATPRAAACAVPINYVGSDAQELPVGDASVDSALSTWTLCRSLTRSRQWPKSTGCCGPAARSVSWRSPGA